MNIRAGWVVICLLVNSIASFAKNNMASITLPDVYGHRIALAESRQARAAVFVFLAPECPICIQSTSTLNKLAVAYRGKGVVFYGIFPGNMYTRQELASFADKYEVNFSLLMDTAFAVTDILHGAVTPQVFVTSASGKVVYKGAIDDAWVALGRRTTNISHQYLADALNAILNDEPIATSETRAIGCLLERQKEQK